MKTPVCDFVKEYAKAKKIRMHMPGHKGKSFIGAEKFDITEIDGADVLYASDGIIRQSEENAASLFGTARTVYSAEGSSLAIRAMLYLTKLYAATSGKSALIAAGRNAHKTFVTAAALLDFEIEWLFGEGSEGIISCQISAASLDRALSEVKVKPVAVYITSPDYLGNIADIKALSAVCLKHGALLLTDNAHGAYLRFLPDSMHPISLGADLCCDSAHKTLPVLTGGAYLHISKSAPHDFCRRAEDAMAVFASTSPSYLILQSLDAANAYISDGYGKKLRSLCKQISKLKATLTNAGYTLAGDEPAKLTICAKAYGYTGFEIADILLKKNIVCEFADPDYAVMMLTPENSGNDIQKLKKALLAITKRPPITQEPPCISKPKKVLSARSALLLPSEELDKSCCSGRVLATPTVSCPPAIPVLVCGEEINGDAIRCFEYYGIERCRVVVQNADIN